MVTVETVVAQHHEEAAFLLVVRDGAVTDPHYALDHLAKLDSRIDAHLDGLRIAGKEGWKISQKALEQQEFGEVLVAGVLAFESGEESNVQEVIEVGHSSLELSVGVV